MRTDWTRAEIAELFDFRSSSACSSGQGARANHAAGEVQLCTLLSIKTGGCPEDCGYCSQSAHADTGLKADEADGRRRGARSRRAQAKDARLAALLHGRGVARPQGPRHARARRRWSQGVQAMGLETCMTLGMLTPSQAERARRRRARLLQPQYRHLARDITATIITTRTFEERLETLENVRDAGHQRSAAAGSSGWARRAPTGSASSTRWRRCRVTPRACRSTRWCRSRARCWATCSPTRRWRRSTTSSSSAPSRSRGSPCRDRWCACPPAARACRKRPRRCASSPAPTASSRGDKLLTAANAGDDQDAAMFAKLGLKPMAARNRCAWAA